MSSHEFWAILRSLFVVILLIALFGAWGWGLPILPWGTLELDVFSPAFRWIPATYQ